MHYNIYGGRHQERKKPIMKDSNKTTTTTTTETQDMGSLYDEHIRAILDDTREEPDDYIVEFDY